MSSSGRSLFFPSSLSVCRCTLFMSLRYVDTRRTPRRNCRTMDFRSIFNWHVSQVGSQFSFCNSEQCGTSIDGQTSSSQSETDHAISFSGTRQALGDSGEMSVVGLPGKYRERISSISEGAETRKWHSLTRWPDWEASLWTNDGSVEMRASHKNWREPFGVFG